MITQDYEIKLVVKVDTAEGDPADWIFDAIDEGMFKYKTLRTYLTEVTPLDREDPNNRWIKQMDEMDNTNKD